MTDTIKIILILITGSNPFEKSFSLLNNEAKHGLQAFFQNNFLTNENKFFSNKSSLSHLQV